MTSEGEFERREHTFLTLFRPGSEELHVLVVLAGFVVWAGSYALAVHAFGLVEVVAQENVAGFTVRRNIAVVSTIVTGLYYGLAYVKAWGAPHLNFIMVIPITLVLVFSDSMMTLGQASIEGTPWTMASGRWEFPWMRDALMIIFSGLLSFASIIKLRNKFFYSEEELREWEIKHIGEPHQTKEE